MSAKANRGQPQPYLVSHLRPAILRPRLTVTRLDQPFVASRLRGTILSVVNRFRLVWLIIGRNRFASSSRFRPSSRIGCCKLMDRPSLTAFTTRSFGVSGTADVRAMEAVLKHHHGASQNAAIW